jgi:hypothetical protein
MLVSHNYLFKRVVLKKLEKTEFTKRGVNKTENTFIFIALQIKTSFMFIAIVFEPTFITV